MKSPLSPCAVQDPSTPSRIRNCPLLVEYINFYMNLFLYFRLCWVFLAARTFPLEVHGLFVAVVSLVAELGYAGALGTQASVATAQGLRNCVSRL